MDRELLRADVTTKLKKKKFSGVEPAANENIT